MQTLKLSGLGRFIDNNWSFEPVLVKHTNNQWLLALQLEETKFPFPPFPFAIVDEKEQPFAQSFEEWCFVLEGFPAESARLDLREGSAALLINAISQDTRRRT